MEIFGYLSFCSLFKNSKSQNPKIVIIKVPLLTQKGVEIYCIGVQNAALTLLDSSQSLRFALLLLWR